MGNSSRLACSDGDLLQAMPLTTVPESPSSGGGLKLSEQLAMNYGASKWMAYVFSELDAGQRWVSPVATVSLHR
jgi:hypothetical protein